MDYSKNTWIAREGTNLNKFDKTSETSASVILTNAPDAISVAGTPFSVTRMNNLENGVDESIHWNGTPDEITGTWSLREGWNYKTNGDMIIDASAAVTIPATTTLEIGQTYDEMYDSTGFEAAVEGIANPYTDQAEIDAVSTANAYTDTEVEKPKENSVFIQSASIIHSTIYSALTPYMIENKSYNVSGGSYTGSTLKIFSKASYSGTNLLIYTTSSVGVGITTITSTGATTETNFLISL